MKKVLKMDNLDCAACTVKMEKAIRKIDGVKDVNISFVTQKMTLEVNEALFDEVAAKAAKACRRIEPECRIIQ